MWLPRTLSPGPPKQFAAFCGFMMTSIGGGLFFGQAKGFYIAGSVVLAILAVLASIEGVLNFCMGCWMFGMAQRFGILLSDSSLDAAMDRLDEQERFLHDEEDHVHLPSRISMKTKC